MDHSVFLTGVGDCLCHTDEYTDARTHIHSHVCKGERTRRLFMLRQNEFLCAVDCCLWENTLLNCKRCNLDCSMTNNELWFWSSLPLNLYFLSTQNY